MKEKKWEEKEEINSYEIYKNTPNSKQFEK